MKSSLVAIVYAFIGALFIGCADTTNSPLISTSPPLPAEEILINNEQFDKPYNVLGQVQYTLKAKPSLFTSQLELREKAIDLLKQQTYAKYGDEVDAIIDTKVEENTVEDVNGKLNIINIQGVAISFLPETVKHEKATSRMLQKRKHKSAKKILVVRKAKSTRKFTEKPAPKLTEKSAAKTAGPANVEEIKITPTEILK